MVEGTGSDLRFNYVSETADVVVGDVVVTSGIEGIFPESKHPIDATCREQTPVECTVERIQRESRHPEVAA